MIRLLVIGGSRFVGRHIVEIAVKQGHNVTVFNRGRIRLDIHEHCTQLVGDRRSGDLGALERGTWDAVIDTCGYIRADVSRMAGVLRSRVEHYCFISTGAVYADMSRPITEDSSLVAAYTSYPDEDDLLSKYAELKVACEQELRTLVGSSLSILRLGVVVGPGDYTDRMTYWVRRVGMGGTVLGPPRAEQPLQLLHARDLAETVLRVVSAAKSACANVAGPETTFADLIAACVAASGSDAQVAWGGPEDLPLATPADGSHDGAYQMTTKASVVAAGVHQSLAETCREILAWDEARGRPALKSGIAGPVSETELIAELKAEPKHVGVDDA